MLYTVILTVFDDRKINFSRSCSGTLIFRQANYSDISYGIVCQEPFQKVPKITFLNDKEEVIFELNKKLTPEYKKSLNSWELALAFFLTEINDAVLNCKKADDGFCKTEHQFDLDEKMEMALIS